MYFVNSIFSSFQGEGNRIGTRALFIRFNFCNLTCSWCDTKYTWRDKNSSFQTFSKAQLKNIILQHNIRDVILTGGEPLLYRIDELSLENFNFHIETNGSFIPEKPLKIELADGTRIVRRAMDFEVIKNFNWVVSPKLSNSKQTINSEALSYWAKQDFCTFKFVVKNLVADIDELENLINTFQIDKNKVYIALEGTTLASQIKPREVEYILERGFHYSPRVHILLWGNKRNV